jgi:hypothetical protein
MLPAGALSLKTYPTFQLSGLALGRFAILGTIALQAPQRAVATKMFQVDVRVGVGRPDTDGSVTQLMERPTRCVVLPKDISLPIRQASKAISRAIRSLGSASLSMGNKQRPMRWPATGHQILVSCGSDLAGEEDLASPGSIAPDGNRAFCSGDVLKID